MCGIAGFTTRDTRGIPDEVVNRAIRLLRHRGPDDYGFLSCRDHVSYLGRDVTKQVAGARLLLVHRRLSILDLSESGWQPMQSPDGRYTIVYNGEIYNYLELRSELRHSGWRFRGNSDTEVLLAAFATWKEAALPRLVGMFAFAVLDSVEHTLFLARDFFGIKPLYYVNAEVGVGFASEIKVLLDCLEIKRQINPGRLYDFLRYGMSDFGGETMLRSVRQLPPAHWMRIDLRTQAVREPVCYWALPEERTNDVSFDEAATEVRARFLNNVELHLRSDVPVGAALSGGIDSSAIVAAMRHVGGRRLDLRTFSYIPSDTKTSEERWIDVVGRASDATMHKIRPEEDALAGDLRRVMHFHDEPLGGMSAIAQNHVFQEARREGVKVMLDGQGADEVLGGYHLFLGARIATLIRHGHWGQAARLLAKCSQLPDCSHLGMTAQTLSCLLPPSLQAPLRRLIRRDLEPSWINRNWFRAFDVSPKVRTYTNQRDVLHAQLCRAMTTGLPRLLRFEDRNSMNHSIESRVPFLTPAFVTFLFTLPEHYIISPDGVSKSVFRAAMRGLVPDTILDRQDKAGYPTPGRRWLEAVSPWVEQTLNRENASCIPALCLREVRREWNLMTSGKRQFNLSVWRSLNLISWSADFNIQFSQ